MIPNGITIDSAVFVWVANAILHNALSMERKASKIALSPWDFVTLPEEDRATAIGNTHRKICKDLYNNTIQYSFNKIMTSTRY